MQRLPELEMPPDWKQRTRVFVTRTKPRHGLTPLVSREVYDAERPKLYCVRMRLNTGEGQARIPGRIA